MLLAGAIGIRIAASQPLADTGMVLAAHPRAAIAAAFQGWSTQGSLGAPTAEGVRSLPLALYYAAGEQAHLPITALQAVARGLILIVATLGALRLARTQLRHGAPQGAAEESWAPWLAAVLYGCGAGLAAAVAARPMDALAAAAAPWVLTPLIGRRWGWGGAARSALWIGMAGFASVLWAVAVLGVGLVVAAPRAARQVRQFLIWLAMAALGSAWWLAMGIWEHTHAIDLAELVRPASLLGALEQALGWSDLPVPVTVLAWSAPVLAAALGLALRCPGIDRATVTVLTVSGVVGAVLLGTGRWTPPHYASWEGSVSAQVGPALMCLALAGALSLPALIVTLAAGLRAGAWSTARILTVAAGTLLLVTSGLSVVLAGRERVPDTTATASAALWQDVARWSAAAAPGRALVLPATTDVTTRAMIAGAFADRPWVDRTPVPASGPAATSALDSLIGRLRRGQFGAGTDAALDRLGVTYVVIRDDVSSDGADRSGGALTRRALAAAGATRVADFATEVDSTALVDSGATASGPRVEIWARPDPAEAWSTSGAPLRVAGDTATAADLADATGVAQPIEVVRAEDGPVLLSDTARHRPVDQRVPIDPYGATATAYQATSTIPEAAATDPTSVRRLSGARAVSASSSSVDLDGVDRYVGGDPVTAIDGSPFTSWQSRAGTGVGQWWQIDFDEATPVAGTEVDFSSGIFSGHAATSVTASTDTLSQNYTVTPGQPVRIALPGAAMWLRLTITGVSRGTRPTDQVGITEIRIPDVVVSDQRALAVPAQWWLLSSLPPGTGTCVPAAVHGSAGSPPEVCDPGIAVPGYEAGPLRRVLTSSAPASITGTAWLRAVPSAQAAALADTLGDPSVRATASSVTTRDLRTRPQAAADADPRTAWRPDPSEPSPRLTLTWDKPVPVAHLRVLWADPQVSQVPSRVEISTPAGPLATVAPSADGRITVPSTTTDSLTLRFLDLKGPSSTNSGSLAAQQVPMGVAEVDITGVSVDFHAGDVHALACGSGAPVHIGEQRVPTAVRASAAELISGAPVTATLCADVPVAAGEFAVKLAATYEWTPLGLMLGDADVVRRTAAPAQAVRVDLSTAASTRAMALTATSGAHERTVALGVPAGSGWTLRDGGQVLPTVTIDGWAQGWLVPAAATTATLDYPPGGALRLTVLLGWVAWACVAVIALGSLVRSEASRGSGDGSA